MSLSSDYELFTKNTSLLIKKYPSFKADILDKYSPSSDLLASEAADGYPTANIEGIWIHSTRAPMKEAQKLVRNGIKNHNGVCMVFGFGLGYHVEALLEKFPDIKVLILEPEPEIFLKAARIRDFSIIIDSERTGFLFDIPPELISGIVSSYKTSNIQSLKLRSLYSRNSEYYQKVDDELKSLLRKKETNKNTLNRFGRTWIRNLFRNIEVFSHACDTGMWYNRFTDIPALVIAAGPSLDTILPLLPELRKHCVVICVDTALRAVMEAGTIPDFIVVVDPQYLNTRHLDSLLASDKLKGHSVLVSESSTHPGVFRHCKIPVFFFKSIFPLGKLIETSAGIHSELGAGGSVATTAWDFARKLGCPQIYTAGLDLGFPNQNTHCRTSLSYFYSTLTSKRTKPLESINFKGVRSAQPYLVENNSEGLTLTDQRLIIYKWWFEGQIASAGRKNFYNLSENGILLKGMPYTNFRTILESRVCADEINLIKTEVMAKPAKSDKSNIIINEILNGIITECSRLEAVCSTALSILSEIDESSGAEIIKDKMKTLSELDQQISNSPSKELTGFIIQPVLNEIIDQEGTVFENSEKLYSNLLDACEYHRLHAERVFKRKNTGSDSRTT